MDFDGVICDGLMEYFATAWRTYQGVWGHRALPPDLDQQFYRLRPVIETGWEMPVLIHALCLGMPEGQLFSQWRTVAQDLITQQGITALELGTILDQLRDEWITEDLASWLALHRFYPGVVARLQQPEVAVVIITTKEGRFVQALLEQGGLDFDPAQIFGKERKQSKPEILRTLHQDYAQIWFVEDRLLTLQAVRDRTLPTKLYLADWGYNTELERKTAQCDPRIHLLNLATFGQSCTTWP